MPRASPSSRDTFTSRCFAANRLAIHRQVRGMRLALSVRIGAARSLHFSLRWFWPMPSVPDGIGSRRRRPDPARLARRARLASARVAGSTARRGQRPAAGRSALSRRAGPRPRQRRLRAARRDARGPVGLERRDRTGAAGAAGRRRSGRAACARCAEATAWVASEAALFRRAPGERGLRARAEPPTG